MNMGLASGRKFPRLVCAVAAWLGAATIWPLDVHGAPRQTSLIVDAGKVTAVDASLLFGQNIPFALSGIWNSNLDQLDLEVEGLARAIEPKAFRFPGGSWSDLYLWEDGLSFRTTAPMFPGQETAFLDDAPSWNGVSRGRFFSSGGGPLGDPFEFSVASGSRIEGVSGFAASHPTGAAVRLEFRPGQPEWFNHGYGIDEHLQLAQSLEAVPVVTVNFGTGIDRLGTVSTGASLEQRVLRAAAWVAYANGSPDDTRALGIDREGNDWKTVGHWAQKREASGRKGSPRVEYWEIGNELYERSEPGFTSAADYAEGFLAFSRAMKAVDPSIKVGAVGMAYPNGIGDADTVDPWNATVLKKVSGHLDFFVVHPFFPSAVRAQVSFSDPRWFQAVMGGAHASFANLREIRRMLDGLSPGPRPVELLITEYGIWPSDSPDPRDFSNLAAALHQADFLMHLVLHGKSLGIPLATAWHLHSHIREAFIRYDWNTGHRVLRPQYHAFELVRKHLRTSVHPVEPRNVPTFDVPALGNMKRMRAVPSLQTLASSDGKGKMTLMVLNRSLKDPIKTGIELKNFQPSPAAWVTTLSAHSPGAHNEDDPSTVVPARELWMQANRTFLYTFPPHSLTIFELETP